MRRFQRKTVEVIATQWFELGDHPSVYLTLHEEATKEQPTFSTKFGNVVVNSGDWIVEIGNDVKILKDDYFKEHYVEIVERIPTKFKFVTDCE